MIYFLYTLPRDANLRYAPIILSWHRGRREKAQAFFSLSPCVCELTPSDFGIESNDFEHDEYYQNRLTEYDFYRFGKMEERFEKRMKNKKRKINKKIEFDKIIQSREEDKNIYSDKRLENMIKTRV